MFFDNESRGKCYLDGGDIMTVPYSDKRWNDAMGGITSMCCFCQYWKGFGECEKYEGRIPDNIIHKSFPVPGTMEYDNEYCKYRREIKKGL